jgi:quercetin dioxygenase-like cupin family protein
LRTLIVVLLFVPAMARAQDPVQTDRDKYRLVLENERVRVLEYRDKPGGKTQRHSHPAFVLYALAPFKRRLTFGVGRITERSFKAGEAVFMDGQTHVGENIGDTETHALIVELKHVGLPSGAPKAETTGVGLRSGRNHHLLAGDANGRAAGDGARHLHSQ